MQSNVFVLNCTAHLIDSPGQNKVQSWREKWWGYCLNLPSILETLTIVINHSRCYWSCWWCSAWKARYRPYGTVTWTYNVCDRSTTYHRFETLASSSWEPSWMTTARSSTTATDTVRSGAILVVSSDSSDKIQTIDLFGLLAIMPMSVDLINVTLF